MTLNFNFHPELCVGCGACVMACLDHNDRDPDHSPPLRSLYKKERLRQNQVKITYYSLACLHCSEQSCALSCPGKCFVRDDENGLLLLDPTKCLGCGLCDNSCRFGAISFDKEGKAQKCNGCPERLSLGQLPACAAACARKAITIDEKNDILETSRQSLAKQIQTLKLQHAAT